MIHFLKIRDVASPERETGNAGFDFFVPKFNEQFKADCTKEAEKNPKAGCYFKKDDNGVEYIEVPAGERVCIPSGIKSRIELSMPISSYGLGIDLLVENKSGISTKYGLDVGAVEIDENYQGEIHLSVTNASNQTVKIFEDMKITQLVPRVYITEEAKIFEKDELSNEDFYKNFKWNNRGENGFGSTGNTSKNV